MVVINKLVDLGKESLNWKKGMESIYYPQKLLKDVNLIYSCLFVVVN